MNEIGLSLGSNVGEKAGTLRRALDRLARSGVHIRAVSSLYRTPPWGHADQDWFVNLCAVAETALVPLDLLRTIKAIEAELGRQTTFRWGPREIDIDIVWYDGVELATAELTLPHPALFERGFVLVPLAEIAADKVIAGRRIADEAARFAGEQIIKIAPPPGRSA